MKLIHKFMKRIIFCLLVAFVGFSIVLADADKQWERYINEAWQVYSDHHDIPYWAARAIYDLSKLGIFSGDEEGNINPNELLTRAELSKIVVLSSRTGKNLKFDPEFTDFVPQSWYSDYITTMYNEGWVSGYPDGSFGPEKHVNRAEMAKIMVLSHDIAIDLSGAPHFTDVEEDQWYYETLETAYNNGCMRGYGDGTFRPEETVTRAEAAQIVYDCTFNAWGE